jgi:hypothetical protein
VISQGFHRGFTAAEKTELWDRWQRGESLKAIRRAFSKPSSSIYFQLAPHGGIRPAARRRSRLALTLSKREEISRGIAAAQSARSIARLLSRSPLTVSRELNRNGGYDRYRAALADEMAWARARRPKRCKLANNPRLRQAVASKRRLNCSPEQIAGWLKRWPCGDGCNHVSNSGREPKSVASRLCDLRASTSAVRQADRLRGATHLVVNIRTSEHHIPSRPQCSDVRLVGQETRKRVVELRCPVTVPREIGSLVG